MNAKNIIDFLNELGQNNNREWFRQHEQQYRAALGDFEKLVQQLIVRIAEFDSGIGSVDVRECIFRIYRDVRFSANKDPYKTHFGAYMASGGKNSPLAGYYVHLQPGGSFAGGGIYMPQPDVLKAIRTEIYYNADSFKAILNSKEFKTYFDGIYGEKLKTCPKGFDKEFPDVGLLVYKDYAVVHYLTDQEVVSDRLLDLITDVFKAQQGFNAYLNAAVQQ